jgi:hypothetical protein
MSDELLFEESQHLGYNRLSFLRRMVLALFCFLSFYWSEETQEAIGSGNLLFFLGVAILFVSAVLVFILHFKTKVVNGSLILEGLWTVITPLDMENLLVHLASWLMAWRKNNF